MITVCLLNWRRPDNLQRILDRLAQQTVRPVIFLWNNSPPPFRHRAVDWQVDSGRNVLCPPRWWMASQAETELIMSLDDDLMPADDRLLEDVVAVARRQPADRAIGPYGVNLRPGRDYFPHHDVRCPSRDVLCDIVLGRWLVVRTATLRSKVRLGDLCGDVGHEDDISLCGALAAGRRRYHLAASVFAGRLDQLPEGEEALFQRPDHQQRRNAARRRWFPEP
jgi:hypothetical protein